MTDKLGKSQVEEDHFHDLIHSVTSDGLQDMAWPGMRKNKGQTEEDVSSKNKDKAARPDKKILEPPPRPRKENKLQSQPKQKPKVEGTLKVDKEKVPDDIHSFDKTSDTKLSHQANDSSVKRKGENKVKALDDEWEEHSRRLAGYNSREQNAKRCVVLLPEKLYETFHFVYLRNASASISVALQMFLERNKENMIDAISDRTTLI